VIKVSNLQKRFDNLKAVDDLSRLSLDYARTLSSTVASQDQLLKKKKRGLFSKLTLAISNNEDRAVWRLIQKQFKYDNRFKMSILTIIPLPKQLWIEWPERDW
jgi:hypothetical protein